MNQLSAPLPTQEVRTFGRLGYGTSAPNVAQTVSTRGSQRKRVTHVSVAYSAAPTQTGVTITLNSGLGAEYNVLIFTGTANVQDTLYQFDPPLELGVDDQLDVVAPAAGGVITSSVAIHGEKL